MLLMPSLLVHAVVLSDLLSLGNSDKNGNDSEDGVGLEEIGVGGDTSAAFHSAPTSESRGGQKHPQPPPTPTPPDYCESSRNRNLCLPPTYSKFELPFADEVNVVEIGIDISDVLRIDDKEYSVTFSSYFNVLWQEPRLHINTNFFYELNETAPDALVPVNLELVKDLWLPNIFIYNLKTFKVVEVLSKHAGLWVSPENAILYSQATHITFICPMRFDSFPLDTQQCKFQVGSYSYDDTKMVFVESERVKGYVETSRSIVLDYDVHIAPLSQQDRILNYGSLGNYSLAGFEMILHRYVSHYIITYYLPSGLFVVVSWISFVVPPDVIPGRMALLITLFLVLVNIFNSVTTNTPKAEGLTAIEAWMLACILFVFGALVEYAAILFRRQKDEVAEGSYGGHGSRRNYDGQSVRRQQDNIYGRRPLPKSSSSRRHTVEQEPLHHFSLYDQQRQQPQQFHPQYAVQEHANPIPVTRVIPNIDYGDNGDAAGCCEGVRESEPLNKYEEETCTCEIGARLSAGVAASGISGISGRNGDVSPATTPFASELTGEMVSQMLNPLPMSTPPPSTTASTTKGTNSVTSNHVEKSRVVVQQQHSGAPIGQSIMNQTSFTDVTSSRPQQQRPHYGDLERRVHLAQQQHQHQQQQRAVRLADTMPDYKSVSRSDRRRSTMKRGRRGTFAGRDICGENYINVDRFFLVAMPILFLIFNVVYWLWYGGHLLLADSTPREKY